jgi:ribokinase
MIVVIGSINMDLVLRVPRMPVPGETLSGGPFSTVPGGKGANQAVACARLGGPDSRVAMIGCLGDDAFGTALREALRADGIDDSHVVTLPGVASGVASILVDAQGQNSIVIAGGANDMLSPAHIDAARSLLKEAHIVVLQLETPAATVAHAIALARELGKTVVLNPAPAASLPDAVLSQVDYLIPNEIEAAMLTQASGGPEADTELLRAAGCGKVIVTLGAEGVLARLDNGPAVRYAPQAVNAVDTTAAGDTFIGGFAAALAAGASTAEAIGFGQRAAAIGVTRHGAQTSIPYLSELTGAGKA